MNSQEDEMKKTIYLLTKRILQRLLASLNRRARNLNTTKVQGSERFINPFDLPEEYKSKVRRN